MNKLSRTLKFDGANLYAEIDSHYNASVGILTNSLSQHFYFHYNNSKKAYKICSAFHRDLVLSYNSRSNIVIFAEDKDLDENYWTIENIPNTFKRLIKNFKKNDNNGYLTAVFFQGHMSLILDTNKNYYMHSTHITIDPNLNFIPNLTKGIFYIGSNLDSNKVLTIASNQRNLIITERAEMLNQQWIFRYSLIKDAYLISSNLSDVFISWISPYSNDVIAYPYIQSDSQHWVLKNIGMRTIMFQNYSNHNMILNLAKDPSLNYDKLVVSPLNNNDDNEKFKLILLD